MTYDRRYIVHYFGYDVMVPDQVFERQELWDRADMPFPAITSDGQTIQIRLCETDA